MDENEVKGQLRKLIDYLSTGLPEPQRAKDDLWKFAELHERRTYVLIRFCCAPDSEWSKVRRSIKEITKRIEELITSSSSSSVLDTLLTLIYRSSVLIYNRSHVPAIIQFSRTDEKELGATAHEILGEISKHKSEVFKAHVEELCKTLSSDAPTATKTHRADATQDLKACADFARKFPADIPQDPKFFRSLMSYIKHGQPQAAKYAVVILLTAVDKKEMYAKDIYASCARGFKYNQSGFLSRLAALSQLVLLGSDYLETDEADVVVEIAISKVLTNYEEAYPEFDEEHNQALWVEEPDDNFKAKAWALKILINRLRAYPDGENVTGPAKPVYSFLETLIQKSGQFSTNHLAPEAHASRLRLLAAQHLLKLCRERRFNELLTHCAFNELAVVAQDPTFQVREGFVKKLMKYLGLSKLSKRFYTPLFLQAFEPDAQLKFSVETWLRSRASAFARAKDTSLELLLARLISLLAHHPDFEPDGEPLREMAKYLTFYLGPVATRENISLIFHVAQRIKSVSDGIDKSSQSIYILSDLAQAIVRRWDERQDWGMQTWPGKVNLPAGVFAVMDNHDKAVEVASKMFVPADVMDDLDAIVHEGIKASKGKKRGDGAAKSKKRARPASEAKKGATTQKRAKVVKTPKRKTASRTKNTPASNSERRKSGRNSSALNYRDYSSNEEEDEIVDDESSVTYKKKTNGSASNAKGATKEKEVIDVSDDVDSSSAMEED
jgi:sister chromatid cohesion protein PDS5